MRRRTLEVEEQNDVMRLRNDRLRRDIKKMRLERAILTMHLKNTQTKNGAGIIPTFDEDSENSSDAAPPTVCFVSHAFDIPYMRCWLT